MISDIELFHSVSNQNITNHSNKIISLMPSPSKQKSIDVYRNFSNSDFNHKDLMTLHYIFSNSEYDSSDSVRPEDFLVHFNQYSEHEMEGLDKTKGEN